MADHDASLGAADAVAGRALDDGVAGDQEMGGVGAGAQDSVKFYGEGLDGTVHPERDGGKRFAKMVIPMRFGMKGTLKDFTSKSVRRVFERDNNLRLDRRKPPEHSSGKSDATAADSAPARRDSGVRPVTSRTLASRKSTAAHPASVSPSTSRQSIGTASFRSTLVTMPRKSVCTIAGVSRATFELPARAQRGPFAGNITRPQRDFYKSALQVSRHPARLRAGRRALKLRTMAAQGHAVDLPDVPRAEELQRLRMYLTPAQQAGLRRHLIAMQRAAQGAVEANSWARE